MKFNSILLALTFSTIQLFAQSNVDLINLQNHYELFEYSTVISKSEQLLLDKKRFSQHDIIQIYTLKAVSHYSMSDMENSRKSFVEILKINENFELNNSQFSPKLVTYFNDVKKEFLDILKVKDESEQIKIEPNENKILYLQNKSELNNALAKSILLPGLGHLHLDDNSKGWILTSASIVSLGSMIYFIFDANQKEKNYLAQTNPLQIKIKYDEYNKSYKIRNVLIGTYAAIWLYSQIDILFFSNELGSEKVLTNFQNINFENQQNNILFSFSIPL
ncbi:MAG: hypothetical protein IPH62_08930 [Ignavibacteriae bacterium]|nr:hypothetical protein [Ignavibacteriota bacterium]